MQIGVRVIGLVTGALRNCTNVVNTNPVQITWKAPKAQNCLFRATAFRWTSRCAAHHWPPVLKSGWQKAPYSESKKKLEENV